jgi:hypothetical protein
MTPMHCTVVEVRTRGVFVETRRIEGGIRVSEAQRLSGCMWLDNEDVPDTLRYPGCRFELTLIPHPNGTCSIHVTPLKSLSGAFRSALHSGNDVVFPTLITMLCAQMLIELAITRHDPHDAPWVVGTWVLTLLIVLTLRSIE